MLEYSRVLLEYSVILIEYSQILIEYSQIVVVYSGILPEYSGILIEYSGILIEYSRILLEYSQKFAHILNIWENCSSNIGYWGNFCHSNIEFVSGFCSYSQIFQMILQKSHMLKKLKFIISKYSIFKVEREAMGKND